MNWQYIIVALIGLVCLASVALRIYRLFVPRESSSSCGGCQACGGKK
ncbi:MAG: hypothetical protein SPK09_04455 [Porphyromonas sp.]|nr:hypothetical protein [Porphyromonas sp.]